MTPSADFRCESIYGGSEHVKPTIGVDAVRKTPLASNYLLWGIMWWVSRQIVPISWRLTPGP